jgi:hypothetical protein
VLEADELHDVWLLADVQNYTFFFKPIDWKKGKYSSYSDYYDIIFWDVTTRSLVGKHEPFGGTLPPHSGSYQNVSSAYLLNVGKYEPEYTGSHAIRHASSTT